MATLIDNPKRARQLARAIASDLTLYHEPKILEGIANDSLFEAMSDEINEGRDPDELADLTPVELAEFGTQGQQGTAHDRSDARPRT